jgi:hypothetical protein
MSLPELLQFEHVFVGCLSVRRFSAAPGMAEIRDALMFRIPQPGGASHVAILGQGYEYEGMGCPALRPDGLCGLHEAGKPAMCAAVPLDPLVPDSMQHRVLAERRRDAAFLAADCIVAGTAPDHDILVQDGQVRDAAFQAGLHRQRAALADDKRIWGRAVFDVLAPGLFNDPAALGRIPENGFLALPLIPALLALAERSDACRERCSAYVDAQLALIARAVHRAIQRKRADERPMTQRLRAWEASYRDVRAVLAVRPATPRRDLPVETWLGLALVEA